MKAKKVAIFLVSASLAMGTAEAMTVPADPPAAGSEVPQAPDGEAPFVRFQVFIIKHWQSGAWHLIPAASV